ncbi:unnamed protein product, partial [Candidula unifasciata]
PCGRYNVCLNGMCDPQSSQCVCDAGFITDPINPLQCLPVPPCNLLQGSPHEQCLNGACVQNFPGLYACACYNGYQQSFTNPNICDNIDECRLPGLGCAPGSCTDLIGDYSCTACVIGYTLDQRGKCLMNNQGQNSALPWLFPMMDGMF